ncbi:hypothetical protein HY409_03290 [Candidatus Gottesmanbacteria bacterium]|nr:hypothetical protein [Candidatus Gottesmanbacteria bacterium]
MLLARATDMQREIGVLSYEGKTEEIIGDEDEISADVFWQAYERLNPASGRRVFFTHTHYDATSHPLGPSDKDARNFRELAEILIICRIVLWNGETIEYIYDSAYR